MITSQEKLIERSDDINLDSIADELDDLQSKENNGRGINCVRDIVFFLKNNELEKAKACCFNEGDKISAYASIKSFIIKNLFASQDKHPWSMFEK